MKVQMLPHINHFKNEESGIRRVIEAYFRHLPEFGVEMVHPDADSFDILAVHAGMVKGPCTVAHCHGMYWSADYDSSAWQYQVNAQVIDSIRHAKEVTVPSSWVAETFQRDMRFTPHVIPHGIEWVEWQHNEPSGNYVLWNKNRNVDVCSPVPVMELARRFPNVQFKTTFIPPHTTAPGNVDVTGLMKHPNMKKVIQSAGVYLSSSKETFCVGVLEAMASGTPVLGFDYGGNSFLIEHGVSGYLAEVDNYDDLAEGLMYCVENRATLGVNGRELAKQWTWENACEQVAQVYELATQIEPPEVSVVIPIFNKTEEQIERAVCSAISQTYPHLTSIIVVDDGSETIQYSERVVGKYSDKHASLSLITQRNRGVANARNRGISETRTKYICCLDSDDALEPEFIATCVKALEEDRSLGIAYTGLRYIKPDGETGISQWPEQFDYDKQLQRRNQIPTACVFRREMWERTGGYNPKYSPGGAGSEDAHLWLRAGSIGYDAKKVTNKPLFVYSWQSGIVSGDPHYHEVDWTELLPWAGKDGDGKHPFASVATPKRWSHPVRQFDEPMVSVIIPVGPGHEEVVRDALDSLEHQTMRKWEVIVVWDVEFDENSKLKGQEDIVTLTKAYPYIRWGATLTVGNGAGYARNRGTEIARAPFILFLDADDRLYSKCLERMLEEWNESSAIIYTDFVGKAFVEDPAKLDPVLQKHLYHYDERTQEAVIGHKSADYNCERAQRQPEGERPFMWSLVTALIPKAWHFEIGGFDEQMESWEDADYHWRMAKAGKCYTRIPEELMVYQFHTGHRRERGDQGYQNLLDYLREKHRKESIMPCRGCGGSRRASSSPTHQPTQAQQVVAAMSDDVFVMCRYMDRKAGDHQVYGPHGWTMRMPGLPMTRLRDGRYHINYGYRPGVGKVSFLVHKEDLALAPTLFIPISSGPVTSAPQIQKEELSPPEPLSGLDSGGRSHPDDRQVAYPAPAVGTDDLSGKAPDGHIDLSDGPEHRPFDLQSLPGVGGVLAQQLMGAGVASKEDVLALGVEGLQQFAGVGPVKAENIIESIQEMP